MMNDDVARRLDTVIAILKLAHHDEIETARATIRANKVDAAILDLAVEQKGAGELIAAVGRKTKQSPSTIKRRLAELVATGVVERSGAGSSTAYRATGLV
jgi:Fic family protein